MAQLVEHILGKDEVPGPNPGSSSKTKSTPCGVLFVLDLYSRFESGFRMETGSYTPLVVRQARLADAECGYLRALREYPGHTIRCAFCFGLVLSLRIGFPHGNRFVYPTRSSASSLGRRRVWVSSCSARIPGAHEKASGLSMREGKPLPYNVIENNRITLTLCVSCLITLF